MIKKIVIFFIPTLILFLLLYFLIFKDNKKDFVYFNLEEKNYLLKEAKNPKEWQEGLSFIKKPVDYDGMIFIFPDKQIRSFWNKNTFVDLEIFWLDDDKIVGKSYLPSILKTKNVITITSPAPVNKVVEIIK
jgi:uncharacterized membrane protein (UPF0127 family)